mmetsp:Transcript_9609/g.23590  ORF Transcript_9609/g.23590 Transcript_9609/m.23590 type:complete len:231 (-) Transcript_9609:763-1455(-)
MLLERIEFRHRRPFRVSLRFPIASRASHCGFCEFLQDAEALFAHCFFQLFLFQFFQQQHRVHGAHLREDEEVFFGPVRGVQNRNKLDAAHARQQRVLPPQVLGEAKRRLQLRVRVHRDLEQVLRAEERFFGGGCAGVLRQLRQVLEQQREVRGEHLVPDEVDFEQVARDRRQCVFFVFWDDRFRQQRLPPFPIRVLVLPRTSRSCSRFIVVSVFDLALHHFRALHAVDQV